MAPGRKAAPLILSNGERARLEAIVRRRSVGQALAQRACIVLACAEAGSTNAEIARRLGVSRPSVTTWRARFLAHRLGGLVDLPRSGAPRQVGDEQIERLIALTLESRPDNATHWSTRTMAKRAGMSQTMVSRVWRAFGLAPHRHETFKLSADPAFVDKVRDVVGLYMAPPDRALVLGVDEKPQIQAVERTAPVLPMRPGQLERVTHDSRRHGATDLFAALDVKTGTVIGPARAAIAPQSSAPSWTRSKSSCPPTSMCISCWTTRPRTKPSSSTTGSSNARAGACTSRPPRLPGSIWSRGGSRF